MKNDVEKNTRNKEGFMRFEHRRRINNSLCFYEFIEDAIDQNWMK